MLLKLAKIFYICKYDKLKNKTKYYLDYIVTISIFMAQKVLL
jgi:hypothetical protein